MNDFEQAHLLWYEFETIEAAIVANRLQPDLDGVGFDTLIMNQTIKLEDVIIEHLVNTTDPAEINFSSQLTGKFPFSESNYAPYEIGPRPNNV